jgi:hypothetical protein
VIRLSPCEQYLKYLVVHPNRLTNDQIEQMVKAQELDYIGKPHLEHLRATCTPPNPFYPERADHAMSTRFLLREKLEVIFRPDRDMSLATQLLEQPRAKELIESMLIAGSNSQWIYASLKRMGIKATVQAVDYYRFYYFNLDHINPDQLRAFMLARTAMPVTDDPHEQMLNEYYRHSILQGERVQMANMAITPYAGMLSLMRRGLLPANVEIPRLAAATRLTAMIKTDEAMMAGKSAQSRDYSFVVKVMSEVMQETGEVEEGLQEGLTKLILKTDQKRIPNIKELSDGHHTVDLQPIDAEGEVVDGERKREGSDPPRTNG